MLDAEWMGRRVSVRRVLERRPDGSLHLGDVVGDLVGLDAQTAVLDSRAGLVEIPLALVAAARLAPPSTADELALERVAARGVRSVDTAELDGWTLRADHGFLRRANSVLPLRQLRRPLEEALDAARGWYAERGLPLRIAVPVEARRLLDAELGERGWSTDTEAGLYVARLDMLDAPEVQVAGKLGPVPDNDWLALYRGGEGVSDAARALLARHDRVVFLSLVRHGRTLAIGRGVVDDGWLGVSGVEVAPDARRQGLAGAVMNELWRWGRDQGASRSYLQVETDNHPARTLYDRLGYRLHHEYRYRRDPQ